MSKDDFNKIKTLTSAEIKKMIDDEKINISTVDKFTDVLLDSFFSHIENSEKKDEITTALIFLVMANFLTEVFVSAIRNVSFDIANEENEKESDVITMIGHHTINDFCSIFSSIMTGALNREVFRSAKDDNKVVH